MSPPSITSTNGTTGASDNKWITFADAGGRRAPITS